LATHIYKPFEIDTASERLTSKGWFPKAFITTRTRGKQQRVHTVYGGKNEMYSTELVANAIATGFARAWINLQPPIDQIESLMGTEGI
jgi:hypothetical protein